MNTRNTDDIFSSPTSRFTSKRTVKLYVIYTIEDDLATDEVEAIEGMFVDESKAQEETDSQEEPSTQPEYQEWPTRRLSLLAIAGIILIILVVVAGSAVSSFFLSPATATIRITPISRQIQTMGVIPINNQIGGRGLSSITMSQIETIPATGETHQDAQLGRGMITFYNAATYAQTIAAGTTLIGSDGVQIVTDETAPVPPARYPTFGQASVPAHAVQQGASGNIRAGDVYGPCCLSNMSAINSAFTGGRDAKDFQSVTQQDINTGIAKGKTVLIQAMTAAFQTQVHPDETLVTPLSYTATIATDHAAGDGATQVQVTVTQICTGAVYNSQDMNALLARQSAQEAMRELGSHYSLIGGIQTSITAKDATTLQVTTTGVYGYQFTQQELDHMGRLIVGKTQAQALDIVLHTYGVKWAALTISKGNIMPQAIQFSVL